MDNIACVVMSNCTRKFDKEYHYLIPIGLKKDVVPGKRVIVPFGKSNKSAEAYVIKILDSTDFSGLKEIKKVIDEVPVLNENIIKLAEWMKYRYICTFSDAVKTMIPPGAGVKSTMVVRSTGNSGKLKPSEEKILEFIDENGGVSDADHIKSGTGIKGVSRYIRNMESLGVVSISEEYNSRVREKTLLAAFIAISREEIIEEIESNRIKRIQQIRVLEILMDSDYIFVQDLIRFAGVSTGVLNTLKKYGYIDFKEIEVTRTPQVMGNIRQTRPLVPTKEQSEVLDYMKKKLDGEEFGEVLLHGVTGSGKTEVYLQLIQYSLEKGNQAIVLVPEISLTPQMVERFKGRFGDDVAVLHSRMSLGERYDQWRLIRDGKIKVAVGARSAIFAPFRKLGIVIIDEEHENSYKSEITPKYHAADVARERCKMDKAVLLCGSATPSVETYFKALKNEIDLLVMKDRANSMMLPEVQLVDMRAELEAGNRSIFSRKLAYEISKNIELRQQTILFLNRRGYASFILCRNCGLTLKCPNCNISMTYHARNERIICHYCGYTVQTPQACPRCKSKHIRHFGTGTQKVEEEVHKQFPESTAIRMDMDTTVGKNSHEEILRNFREKNINVMVGTQMIAKGHDFPKVTLVGVLAADTMLNTGDYKASERTFQLITQVAGRAGRGDLPGRVIIQTYNTEDFSILSACSHDYAEFYKKEIMIRNKLNYPPFTIIALVMLSGINDKMVFERSKEVKSELDREFCDFNEYIEVLGPSRSPLSKIKNKYRWRIIIKCGDMEKIISVLSNISDRYYDKKRAAGVDLSVDINPVNML